MNQEQGIIFVICFSIACILFYKFYLLYRKKKDKTIVKGICTDTVYRTGYNKNTYAYFYSYKVEGEEYNTSDTTRFKLPLFSPKIKKEVTILVDLNNPQKHVTPLEMFLMKIYLWGFIILIILPFLFLI